MGDVTSEGRISARRASLALAGLLAAGWLLAGIRWIPADSDRLHARRLLGGGSAWMDPGPCLAPPLLASIVTYPRGTFEAYVRVESHDGRPLASSEGAGLIAAGTLRLRVDPSGAPEVLLGAFPKGLGIAAAGEAVSTVIAPALMNAARNTSFADLIMAPEDGLRVESAALWALGLGLEEGKVAFYPTAGLAPPAPEDPEGRRVLLIGLDGADWEIISPLMEAGRLPNIQRLVRDGASARLRALEPMLSPLIWTSIATGVGPEKHGIVDFLATSSVSGAQIPVTSNMRRVKALWNILSDRGRTSGVIGWWASWPAERVEGFTVSDRVAYQLFGLGDTAEGLRHRTFPEALGLIIQPKIVKPEQVGPEEVDRFIPAGKAPADHEEPRSLRTILASTRSYLEIGLDLFRAYDPDLKAIYFEGMDTVAHSFMRYRRPAMAGVSPAEIEAYGDVVDRFYEYQDEAIGRLLDLADERTIVILCSDHGFRTGANRPLSDPRILGGGGDAADWHRKFGVLIVEGPGVRRGIRLDDASVLDVGPTVLAAMGLPVSEEMDGEVLAAAFEPPLDPAIIATYESGDSATGGDPIGSALDPEIIQKLTALGYISQEGSNALNNSGLLLLQRGRYAEAARTFEQAIEKQPGFIAARINLARAHIQMDDHETARRILRSVLEDDPGRAEVQNILGAMAMQEGDMEGAETHFRASLAIEPGDTDTHNSLGLLYGKMGQEERALREFEAVISADPDYAEAYNNIGLIHRKRGDPPRAIEWFRRAIAADPSFAGSYNNMGLAFQDLGQLGEARETYERGLQVEPDNAVIINNLGTVDLARGDPEAAFEVFRRAIEADPEYASAHNNMGATLGILGRADEALEKYREAVALDPNYGDARFNLARELLTRGRLDEATAELEEVLRIDPGYGKALIQMAVVRLQTGDLQAALDLARRAADAEAGSVDPHNLLAEIYLRMERPEEAERELERSLAIDGTQAAVLEMLGRLREGG